MNTELILKMVRPYLKNNQLSFKDFKHLFSFLSRQEQYLVVDVLIAQNIEFITDDGKKYDYSSGNTLGENEKNDEEIELDVELAENIDDVFAEEENQRDKNEQEKERKNQLVTETLLDVFFILNPVKLL